MPRTGTQAPASEMHPVGSVRASAHPVGVARTAARAVDSARSGARAASSAGADRPAAPARPAGGVPGRRTVTIRGYGADPMRGAGSGRAGRRPPRRAYERAGFRPDRMAMWAVLLGVLLVVAAATSSHRP